MNSKSLKNENQCIGESFVQLDNLDLTQQTISWYKLYKAYAVDSDFDEVIG